MDSTQLVENFEDGTFYDPNTQRQYVRCEFNPTNPIWIDITTDTWKTKYNGIKIETDWNKLNFNNETKAHLKIVITEKLKKNAPTYITQSTGALSKTLDAAQDAGINIKNGFKNITAPEILAIWRNLSEHNRSLFRSLYLELANKQLGGADLIIAKEMREWKARSDKVALRNILQWDKLNGAFISLEWQLIKDHLEYHRPNEPDYECAIRILGQILAETLKRPTQVLSMEADSLWVIEYQEGTPSEYFLRVPKAKGQTGEKIGTWQITENLGKEIISYSKRKEIRDLQETHNRLIVFPSKDDRQRAWVTNGQVGPQAAKSALQNYFRSSGVISPRTGQPINVTPYRIRHTGATALAIQGFPRDQIQEVLEHDSPYSADAYINAVGADLIPALENATNREVGKVFSMLSDSYFFRGQIANSVSDKPILIPTTNVDDVDPKPAKPAVVGSCGKSGACTKHPFWACYNGCEHFLAWKDADHTQSLEYVEGELKRWSKAEGGKERTKLYKDFDRIAASIREVMTLTSTNTGSDNK